MNVTKKISNADWRTIKLCIASAWLHGSIQAGKVHELEHNLGLDVGEIGRLNAIEAAHIEDDR